MRQTERNEYLDRALAFTLQEIKKRKPSSEGPRRPKNVYPKGVTFAGLDPKPVELAKPESPIPTRRTDIVKIPPGLNPMESLRDRVTAALRTEGKDPADSAFLTRLTNYQARLDASTNGTNDHVNGNGHRGLEEFGVSRNPVVPEKNLVTAR